MEEQGRPARRDLRRGFVRLTEATTSLFALRFRMLKLSRTPIVSATNFAFRRNRQVVQQIVDAINQPAASVGGINNRQGVVEVAAADDKAAAVGKPARARADPRPDCNPAKHVLCRPKRVA